MSLFIALVNISKTTSLLILMRISLIALLQRVNNDKSKNIAVGPQ